MVKKPILRNENGANNSNNAIRAQIRKLSPVEGDILVISGDTPGLDPEGFVRSVERFVPDGVRFLFVPDTVDVELMTEEQFNSLGYYRLDSQEGMGEGNDEEE